MRAPLRPAPSPQPGRLVALDHLRGFVVLLVVLHHAVLAYCTFGYIDHRHYLLSTAPVVDSQRWLGFDILVLLNDGFFMPLLFLLSGLFVWSSLSRKGAGPYLRGRLLRLALPFAVAELMVVPLAYYPSFLQAGGLPGFATFWTTTVTVGPWPSGPPWFVAVLLLFDTAVAALFFLFGHLGLMRGTPTAAKPACCFGILLAGSLLAYLPLLAAVGPSRWLSFGPFAIQGSRVGLYAFYFATGIILGINDVRNTFPFGGSIARQWTGWGSLAFLAGMVFAGMAAWRAHGADAGLSPRLVTCLLGTTLAIFCATAVFGVLAMFLKFDGNSAALSDSLAANSYGIYLLHYPAVTWMQYGLLHVPGGAVVKGTATFAVALMASWGGTILLRRLPGVHRAV